MALLEFYGTECPHCMHMAPLVERLRKEEGLVVEQLETWHDRNNAEKMAQYDRGLCGGVPFFINTETGKHLCGATDYETLKKWAKGS